MLERLADAVVEHLDTEALRRLLRESTVRELREAGVPVTAWEGPASLAPVLLSLSSARGAPRRRRT